MEKNNVKERNNYWKAKNKKIEREDYNKVGILPANLLMYENYFYDVS